MLYKIYRLPVELYGKSVYADMYFIIGKGGGIQVKKTGGTG